MIKDDEQFEKAKREVQALSVNLDELEYLHELEKDRLTKRIIELEAQISKFELRKRGDA